MAKVAFLGLGVMGYPMAGHLVKAGHEVTVYNRTATKAEAWTKEHGGSHAETPKAAAEGCDFVMACVGNDDDLRSVCLGEDGAFGGMADDHDHQRFLVFGALAQVSQETHGRGRVGEGAAARLVQRRDQHSASDSDALADIIVLRLPILLDPALSLGEYHDQVGRCLEKGFFRIGPDRGERGQPCFTGLCGQAMRTVETPLFLFRGKADGALFFFG